MASGNDKNNANNANNVTFVNFRTRQRASSPEEVAHLEAEVPAHRGRTPQSPSAQVSHRHFGSTMGPAATRLISFISRRVDSGRLQRGRDYARAGNVVGLDIRVGAAHGRVAGSQNQPFEVLLQLPHRSSAQLLELSHIMARESNSLRLAREGVVSEELLDILLGEESQDLRVRCTCPDGALVCKHIVAVGERLAARMDADPGVVFALRGLDFRTLERNLLNEAGAGAQDVVALSGGRNLAESNELFWSGRELPDLPEPKTAPVLEDSDMDLLRKALRAVCHTNIELLRAVSDIEELYEHLTR
ncbi:SWIM zinc finger family protein [Corynebacterium lizhenjunii]|uniref:SWIM zinc finger family protein n=1 Tax=Corynebacterium lizhenjunii TaxID=2709394 RepID=UPI0013EBFB44|nr:SWIM zinc finger family protein [Corynebacterium lizhenjunii]